jgi:transposase
MPNQRLSMRHIKEVLRLYFEQKRSRREIARSLKLSPTTVADYLQRAQVAGLGYPLPEGLNDDALHQRLFPTPPPVTVVRPAPDWPQVYADLKRKGMTLTLAWQEYKAVHPAGYQFSWFSDAYRRYVGQLDITLRQNHSAGVCLVDYGGLTVPVVDGPTGEIRQAQVFVGVLGASNYTYCEATWTQTRPDWIGAHVRMLAFFGGVPEVLVPDNLKSGVKHACFFDPELNPTYREFAAYYGVAVLPARPGKPRDKAKVEVAVQIVERWVLARLRHRTFFTLAELNRVIRELLVELNQRPFKKLPGTRLSLFAAIDQPALKPLPLQPYEFAEWQYARVNIDCHIEVDGHYYSVPYCLLRQQVEVRLAQRVVEVCFRGNRVASHARSYQRGYPTTLTEHLPPQHQNYLGWTPERLVRWAERIGKATGQVIESILTHRQHPQQGYRACLGILRFSKTYGPPRLEAACQRALRIGALSYRSIHSILKTGLDQQPLPPAAADEQACSAHDNVRGPSYYH